MRCGKLFARKVWRKRSKKHTPSSPTYRRLKDGIADSERDLYGSFRPTEQVALAWQRTQEVANIVGAKVIVFQCPGSFAPTRQNVRNPELFFGAIDRGQRMFAWEPRGDEWTDEIVRDICIANGLFNNMSSREDALRFSPCNAVPMCRQWPFGTDARRRFRNSDMLNPC